MQRVHSWSHKRESIFSAEYISSRLIPIFPVRSGREPVGWGWGSRDQRAVATSKGEKIRATLNPVEFAGRPWHRGTFTVMQTWAFVRASNLKSILFENEPWMFKSKHYLQILNFMRSTVQKFYHSSMNSTPGIHKLSIKGRIVSYPRNKQMRMVDFCIRLKLVSYPAMILEFFDGRICKWTHNENKAKYIDWFGRIWRCFFLPLNASSSFIVEKNDWITSIKTHYNKQSLRMPDGFCKFCSFMSQFLIFSARNAPLAA